MRTSWWLAVSTASGLWGCGSEKKGGDEVHDLGPIGGDDAAAADADAGAPRCERDEQCDDGQFCNGVERCLPAALRFPLSRPQDRSSSRSPVA